MLKSKLEKFLAKRVFFIFLVLMIYDVVYINQKWTALVGLAVGASLSILKLSSYVWVFSRLFSPEAIINNFKHGVAKSVLNFVINQIIILVLLFISLKINQWLFYGFVAGILLVPAAIMINSVTEVFGITRNNFE